MLRLHDLLQQFSAGQHLSAISNTPITGVAEDSRLVRPGDVFIARPGAKTDGATFAAAAVAKGAIAIITEKKIEGLSAPQLIVPSASALASAIANICYGKPSETIKVLGVTGTNGKTTTAYLIRHLLAAAHRRCGMIGTVEIDDGKRKFEANMTTPGACDVAALLSTMRDTGCWGCAMEVSSHALDQHRVEGVKFAGAGFTNLTGDHLDYHKTMEQYAAAKARLFENLDPGAIAVVNGDDEWSDRLVRDCRARVIRFGWKKPNQYHARNLSITYAGSNFTLVTPTGEAFVSMQLVGRHNVENALIAAALVGEVFGLSPMEIAFGLSEAAGAPGRLQPVRAGQPFAVLVDYAHTDDALENVLTALRPLTRGRLRLVFGCGGDRDRTKRPRMASTASRLADVVYVTSDNPRTEDPHAIVDEICAGFPQENDTPVHVEVDRRRAIEMALQQSRAGDVVLLAGKGHENYQIMGTVKHHFDDVEEALRVLKRRAVA